MTLFEPLTMSDITHWTQSRFQQYFPGEWTRYSVPITLFVRTVFSCSLIILI